MYDRLTQTVLSQGPKTRKPIKYWTANIVNGLKLNEIDRHESKAILTARNGHAGIIYKAVR